MPFVATVDDVEDIAGVELTESQVRRAHYNVEPHVGRLIVDEGEGVFSASDLAWLKRVVAYQAAYLAEHESIERSADVSQYSEQGTSATLNPNGAVFCAQARVAAGNLSWVKSRSVQAQVAEGAPYSTATVSDDPYAPGWSAI